MRRRVEPWALEPPDPHPDALTPDARADRLWALLKQAVATDATRPRVPLSGGLDSRAIAAAAAAVGLPDLDAGTFGEADAVDRPVARAVAAALGLPHVDHELPPDAPFRHEARVFGATDGLGGLAAAPGADTDEPWADRGLLLSGTSGDVIWGDTERPGPSPPGRLRRLGLPLPDRDDGIPPAPAWASDGGRRAWANLHTRQARRTWLGARSRLAFTPVRPVPWGPSLLSFCLALGDEDRRGRALLRRMLARHTAVSAEAFPPVHGPVFDLDRGLRSPGGQAWMERAFEGPTAAAGMARLVLRPAAVARLVRLQRRGKRDRAGLISRLGVLLRWAQR